MSSFSTAGRFVFGGGCLSRRAGVWRRRSAGFGPDLILFFFFYFFFAFSFFAFSFACRFAFSYARGLCGALEGREDKGDEEELEEGGGLVAGVAGLRAFQGIRKGMELWLVCLT